ncbi:MAG: pseudoazurin [Pseudomonadota bacterium]
MSVKLDRRQVLAAGAAIPALSVTKAFADGHSHTVEMLNKHPDDPSLRMVFNPRILSVEAGETVLFTSVDKGHNSESIDGMLPEGAEEWKGRISQDVTVTFDKPGIYGVQCTPHLSMGMVALVIVEGEGKLDNMEEAKGARLRGRAGRVMEELWEEAAEMGLLEESTA